MRLGIAFGARGRGKALAHYESSLHVINLTKLKGAGSLAHEWGHALDAYLGRHFGVKGLMAFASLATNNVIKNNGELGAAVQKLNHTLKYTPLTVEDCEKEYDTEMNKLINSVKNSVSTQCNQYIQKFNKTPEDFEVRELTKLGMRFMSTLDEQELTEYSEYIGSITEYSPLFTPFWGKRAIRARESLKLARVSQINSINSGEYTVERKTKFYSDAIELDKGRKEAYYSASEELFARAFESFVYDTLVEQGIQSQYLVHSVSNKYYGDYSPYPEGADRSRINKAFKNLIKVMKAELNLGSFEYSKLYANSSDYKSYKEAIHTVTRTSEQTPQGFKQKLAKLNGEPINADYREYMDKLATWGKQAFGFTGIGFGEIPLQAAKNTNSKAFMISNKRLVVDIKAKREKQVEALIEALVYFTVELRYRATPGKLRAQVAQGTTYALCKHLGLDVRTYCIGSEYEEIASKPDTEAAYLKSCREVSTFILNSIGSK